MLTAKAPIDELERFVVDEEIKRGYQHVITPVIAKTELYKTSGHYPYYKRHHVSSNGCRRRGNSPSYDMSPSFYALQIWAT